MTTIVAVKDKKGAITYGWDSQGTLGYDIETFTEDQPKVFTNGGVVFGVAGRSRVADVVEFMDVPEVNVYHPQFGARRWVVTELVPALFREVGGAGFNGDESKQPRLFSNLLVTVQDRLLTIHDDGGVTEYDPYAGVGSGSVHAVGVLARGGSVLEALEFAAGKDIFTSGPFTVKTVTELLND